MTTKVSSIDKIEFDDRNPGEGKMRIMATGHVNTGGWSNPQLEKLRSKDADGNQMYRFIAEPPGDGVIVSQGFEEVYAETVLELDAANGVSIQTSTNTIPKRSRAIPPTRKL